MTALDGEFVMVLKGQQLKDLMNMHTKLTDDKFLLLIAKKKKRKCKSKHMTPWVTVQWLNCMLGCSTMLVQLLSMLAHAEYGRSHWMNFKMMYVVCVNIIFKYWRNLTFKSLGFAFSTLSRSSMTYYFTNNTIFLQHIACKFQHKDGSDYCRPFLTLLSIFHYDPIDLERNHLIFCDKGWQVSCQCA